MRLAIGDIDHANAGRCPGEETEAKSIEIIAIIAVGDLSRNSLKLARDWADVNKLQGVSYLR